MDGESVEGNVSWTRRTLWIAWLLVAVGISFRLAFLAQNRSFWQDELAVACAIEQGGDWDGSIRERLKRNNQIAPLGFVALVQGCVTVLGKAEWCYRLVPFVFSVVGLVLIRGLVVSCLSPTAGLLAIGIVAVSPRVLDYASELKPYSADQAVAAAILYIAFLAHKAGWTGAYLAELTVLGVVAPWLSFPSTFVLASVGAVLLLTAICERRWRMALIIIPLGCAWIVSFAVEYQLVKSVANSNYMLSFWSNHFMPFPPQSWDDVWWVPTALQRLFTNPLKTSAPVVALIACLVGWCRCWQKDRALATWLIGPVVLTMAVSATLTYPFGGRLAQFLIPALSIGLALGFEPMVHARERWLRNVGVALVILCMAEPMGWAAKHAVVGREKESPRRVLQYVAKNRYEGDVLYRSVHSGLSVQYYGPRVGLPAKDWLCGHNVRFDQDDTVQKTFGNSRVWFYFGHAQEADVKAYLAKLDRHGNQLVAFPCKGSSVFLYDMRTFVESQEVP